MMRWPVAFVCAGLGVSAVNCGGSSRSSLPSTRSEAGTGGGDSGGGDPAAGTGNASANVGGTTARGGTGAGGGSAGLPANGAAGGDSSCACGSEEPACVARLSCDESARGCPPTLEGWLTYDNLPHEPYGRASVSYGLCDDGTTRFIESYPFGEGVFALFDFEGHLFFYGNYTRAQCGEPPPLDDGVMCRWCEVVRAGGLTEIGEAGAGGEGGGSGASGTPTDQQGTPYCLVDARGKLVLPDR